ncbi:spore coat protein YlbD [Terribacillus saccharophilus]|uniref:YlbD family protein n=1 Tax=Terribacillus saccharophilus TaxID=361277 RepID=UPI003981E00B
MSDTNLHPSIQAFRQFVQQHPELIREVRQKRTGWQPYYEKWVLLGEEDPSWQAYKANGEQSDKAEKEPDSDEQEQEKGKEMFGKMMGMANQFDLQKLQGHIHQLNGALENVRQLIGQYQGAKQQLPPKPKAPTFFHRD